MPSKIPGRKGTLPESPVPTVSDPTPPPPTPATRPAPAGSGIVPAEGSPNLAGAVAVARRHAPDLLAKPTVAGVRGGYRFVDGAITDEPAVVVALLDVPRGRPLDKRALAAERGIPLQIEGVPVDLEIADPLLQLKAGGGIESVAAVSAPRLLIDALQNGDEGAAEAAPHITYEPPLGGNLEPVTGAMTVHCHVSPDAGWKLLGPFLQATERKLHLGMYDFTAPHIYGVARALLKNSEVEWQQVLGPGESLPGEDEADSTKADDIKEQSIVTGLKRVGGERFANAFAHVGAGKTFASAYHIKVAVRDDKAFWLSSGNWQSSNQPDLDFFAEHTDRQLISRYNREWHVIVENATLAKRFQRYLDHDFEVASTTDEAAVVPAPALPNLLIPAEDWLEEERGAVGLQVFAPQKFTFTTEKPLTVQPILTPDNYLDVVLDFLRKKPKKRFYFQNQSLNPIQSPTARYKELMELLVEYSNDPDLDARFVFRNIGPVRKKVESLQAAGFNMARIRMQGGCHTKGIMVDSQKILLGSHNVTNQGVEFNRDASLLIEDAGIAQYYERVFLHDWEKLAKSTIREEAVPLLDRGGSEALGVGRDVVTLPFDYFDEE